MYFVFINGFLVLKKAEHRHNHELERRQNPQNEHAELLVDFYTMGGSEGGVVLCLFFIHFTLFLGISGAYRRNRKRRRLA